MTYTRHEKGTLVIDAEGVQWVLVARYCKNSDCTCEDTGNIGHIPLARFRLNPECLVHSP